MLNYSFCLDILKEMLKELNEPLFSTAYIYQRFIATWKLAKSHNTTPNAALFYLLINFIDQNLNFTNKAIFYSLIQHIRQVALSHNDFEMKKNTLASLFAKLIFKSNEKKMNLAEKEIIVFLIDNWKVLDTRK